MANPEPGGEEPESEDPGEIYGDSRIRDQVRLEEQCFLMSHWATLMNELTAARGYPRWRNFTVIDGDPHAMSNNLFGVKNISPLFEITPAQLAALQPKVRIWKVWMCPSSTGALLPVQKEIFFHSHYSKKGLDDILDTRQARGDHVGLKSLSYKHIGVTHGAAEKNILVNMKLVFQNLADIFSSPNEHATDYSNIQEKKTLCENKYAAFSDLIVYPRGGPADGATEENKDYSRYFQIKISVGFANPSAVFHSGQFNLSNEKAQELINVLKKCNEILNLTLIEHEFDFRQDGSVALNIKYQGIIEAQLAGPDADIFGDAGLPPHKKEKLKNIRKQIQIKRKKLRNIEKQVGDEGGSSSSSRIEELNEEIEALRESRRGLSGEDMQAKYSRLISGLADKVSLYDIYVSRKVFGKKGDGDKYILSSATGSDGIWPGGGPTRPDGVKTFWSFPETPARRSTPGAAGTNEWKQWGGAIALGTFEAANAEDGAERREIYENLKNARSVGQGSVFDVGGHGTLGGRGRGTKNAVMQSGNDFRFKFFYLGDLLAVAFRNAGLAGYTSRTDPSYLRYPNFRPIIGNIVFRDPASGCEIENGLNLAHIPISLNLFRAWFSENVVSKQISSYPLSKFITDAIRGLIFPALASTCRVGEALPPGSRISAEIISAPGLPISSNVNRDRIPHHDESWIAGSYSINSPAFTALRGMTHEDEYESYSYLFVHAVGAPYFGRKGDITDDSKSGIFHFNIGKDSGLLKKAVFKRVELTNLVELRSEEGMKQNNDNLQIQRVYDCDLTLVGNSLFRPGMMIFVNPTYYGAGNPTSPRSISRKLGIGGYYLVLEVENIVERGLYETLLTTKFLGFGGGEKEKRCTKTRSSFMTERKAIHATARDEAQELRDDIAAGGGADIEYVAPSKGTASRAATTRVGLPD